MKPVKAIVAGVFAAAAFLACDKDPVKPESNLQLAISPDSVVVRVYDSSTLAVTVQDASGATQYGVSLQYLSRDESVATVNAEGAISALAVGSTYVVTTLSDRPDVRDSVHVRVYAEELPITGAAVPGMESFDQAASNLMRKYAIPGGAIAMVRDGKLVYARGFGYADVGNKTPVQADALFRIASVAKPITAAAIMKLVEEGKLELDDRVAPFIAHLTPAPGATVDPRWEQITIRHLLKHTGGWDRTKPDGGFEPMDRHAIAAAAVNAPAPASAETIIRYMKGMPLDFDPGTKQVYSNFGYAILGRVIERVSGMPYEEYVRARVLEPVGADRTRLGKTRMRDALPEEVKYYIPGQPGLGLDAPLVQSVFPGEGTVPVPYGGFHLESWSSSGGWVSSTVDLLRFLTAVDGRADRPDILSAELVAEITGSGPNWRHAGAMPGTFTVLVRSHNNISWVALFNARVALSFLDELSPAVLNALAQVTSFPTHDLFPTFR